MSEISNVTEVKDGKATLGTVYDVNKQAYNMAFPLNEFDTNQKVFELKEWMEENQKTFFMLLSNERRDYTFFKARPGRYLACAEEVVEILKERGKILDGRFHTEEKDSYEFWIRDSIDGENYFFLFFPAEQFFIDVTGDDDGRE